MGGFRRESESCKLQGPLGDVCGEVCLEVLPAGLQRDSNGWGWGGAGFTLGRQTTDRTFQLGEESLTPLGPISIL